MTNPTRAPTGRKRTKPSRSGAMLTSIIITTNKNSTITAPTYTSTSTMPRNSASSISHKPAAVKKLSTRNRTEWTGLRAVITRNAAAIKTAEKSQKVICSTAIAGYR